jgi:hypothetical protein
MSASARTCRANWPPIQCELDATAPEDKARRERLIVAGSEGPEAER